MRELIIAYPTIVPPQYTLLSLRKIKALTLVPCCVAPFSLLGSLMIMYRILRFDRHDPNSANRRVYHRLLLGLSFFNVFESFSMQFGSLPEPKETGLWGAHGNTATCTTQGFINHICTSAVLGYNAGLMMYFLLTIRYSWSDAYLASWLEKLIHVICIFVPLADGVTGLAYNVYNPNEYGTFCYIQLYPPLCHRFHYPCTRGQMALTFYKAFVLYPGMIFVAFLFVAVLLIFCAVRRQGRRALHIAANRENIQAQTKAVALQSAWFGVVFFNTYVYILLGGVLDRYGKHGRQMMTASYVLAILWAIFFPMQGLLNCILYLRPRFSRLKRERQLSNWSAMKLAAFGGRDTFRLLSRGRRRSTLGHRSAATGIHRLASTATAAQSSLTLKAAVKETPSDIRAPLSSTKEASSHDQTVDSVRQTDIMEKSNNMLGESNEANVSSNRGHGECNSSNLDNSGDCPHL